MERRPSLSWAGLQLLPGTTMPPPTILPPTLALSLLLLGASEQGVARDPAVTAAELEAHVRMLASDEMEGRATGTPGERRAAEYLAAELAAVGAEPAGDDGSFLQRVPLWRWRVSEGPDLRLAAPGGTPRVADHGADYDVVVLGSARGSLRVVTVEEAADVPDPDAEVALFLDASWSRARGWLQESGAVEGVGFGALLVRGSDGARAAREFRVSGRLQLESAEAGADAAAPPRLRVHGDALRELRSGEVASVELVLGAGRESVDAFNVVGVIPAAVDASRPELAKQALVLSAHFDHLGVRSDVPEGEDAVFNGADDDASGCAAVLELAGTWQGREAPARPIVLLLATGEERGLLGTRYYLQHPPVPLAETLCNVNFEMIGRPDAKVGGPGVLWLSGFERSNLGPACDELGLAVRPDPRPDQHFFERSDNYAFALLGIVAQTFSSYDLHTDYHTVHDEADALDYAHMERVVRSMERLVQAIAGGDLEPAWLPGGAPERR